MKNGFFGFIFYFGLDIGSSSIFTGTTWECTGVRLRRECISLSLPITIISSFVGSGSDDFGDVGGVIGF